MGTDALARPGDALGRVLLGRYELVDVIGVGSFGSIYRAIERGERPRVLAVKVLHPQLATHPEARARFEREARAAAMLRHPNGVEVLGTGCDGELHFIVMELVEGECLATWLERGPLRELGLVVSIASQVCDALTAAHARGIVHRDIKPANILVQRCDDGRVAVKLCDFGVARLRPGLEPMRHRPITVRGQVLGTPAYLAPEQASGDVLDHRCDVYALGVVLFEMTTGVLPFFADSPHAVLAQHLTQPPPRPSSLDPDYPPGLERIVLRCLAKDPEARFPTASVLQAALESLLDVPGARRWSHPAPARVALRRRTLELCGRITPEPFAVLTRDEREPIPSHTPPRPSTPHLLQLVTLALGALVLVLLWLLVR